MPQLGPVARVKPWPELGSGSVGARVSGQVRVRARVRARVKARVRIRVTVRRVSLLEEVRVRGEGFGVRGEGGVGRVY